MAIQKGIAVEQDGEKLGVYQIEPGDTLSNLTAKLLNLPVTQWTVLWGYNPHIADPDQIEVGDQIYFPLSPTVPSAAVPPALAKGLRLPDWMKGQSIWYIAAGTIVLVSLLFLKPKPSPKRDRN